jgi:hypothetical protein
LSRPSSHLGAATPTVSRWVAASTAAGQLRADRTRAATTGAPTIVNAPPAFAPATNDIGAPWTSSHRLINAAFEFAQARAQQLGERAGAHTGEDVAQLKISPDPAPEDPALVLIIDEDLLLADDKELIGSLLSGERGRP